MTSVTETAENALTISVFQLFFTEVGGDDGSATISCPFVKHQLEIFKGDVFQHRLCAQVVNDQKVCGEGAGSASVILRTTDSISSGVKDTSWSRDAAMAGVRRRKSC